MSGLRIKNLNLPDSVLEAPLMRADAVEVGDFTVYREVDQPGWRWSTHHRDLVGTEWCEAPTHHRDLVGTEWCEARHVGMVISGRFGVLLRDGTTGEIGPEDVFEIPPGHDAWTIGDEPCVVIEWTGFRAWSPPTPGVHGRVLTMLLFTDLVDSTATPSSASVTLRGGRLSPHTTRGRGASSNDFADRKSRPRETGCSRHSSVRQPRSDAPMRSAQSQRERE